MKEVITSHFLPLVALVMIGTSHQISVRYKTPQEARFTKKSRFPKVGYVMRHITYSANNDEHVIMLRPIHQGSTYEDEQNIAVVRRIVREALVDHYGFGVKGNESARTRRVRIFDTVAEHVSGAFS